ncbi:HCLS1-binding protein 3-like [Ylistrum balloti]|uniref:HCLS1-binding protein 3-like n=1 Tax=Ylistrum balloti TaxID=509963 RepID=UPI002905EFCD|nr:HCLS1-binding protein 3-like [Ylistrum balloti]
MPSATVTVRELKNKDTRVDITVPTYKETKGLLQSTFEFHVVIVSSLPFFKSAKHKPTDVVQYMVSKKFAEFEDLHSKLSAKFSGTVLPPLSKKTLLVNAAVTKERRGNLDSFLKFVACTPKLCTSSVLLEFLGVNGIKAGKYRKDEELEEDPGNSKSSEDQDDSSLQDAPDTEQSLFDDDDDEENTDKFFSKEEDAVGEDIEIGDDYRNRFEGDTKLFEDQDLTGAFTEDDANDFVLPDAKNPKTKEDLSMFTDDDNSDLFQIDDDLDKFLNIETKKPETKPKPSPHPPPEKSEKPEISPQKPPVSQKKPTISTQKPTPATRKPKSSANPSECQAVKPSIKPKPGLSPKPVLPKKPASSEVKPILPNQSATTEKPEKQTVENLDTDDIMQYIQENVTQDDELDLFS